MAVSAVSRLIRSLASYPSDQANILPNTGGTPVLLSQNPKAYQTSIVAPMAGNSNSSPSFAKTACAAAVSIWIGGKVL